MGGSGTDIAIRADSTRSIIFFTGGINDRGRFDASGNLLLGTSTSTGTASQPLQVNGGAYVSENLVIGTSGKLLVGALGTAALPIISFLNDPNTGLFSPGADQVAISTGGTAKFTVGSLDGNPIIENNFPMVRPALDLAFAATKRLDPRVTFVRATSATYVGGDGLVKTAGVNEARFDHNPTTRESLGLLVEEQRTNLLLRSEEFNIGTWSKLNTTITADAVTSPTGTLTADKLVENATTDGKLTAQSATLVASATYSASIYIKAAERPALLFHVRESSYNIRFGGFFNTSTGVFTAESAGGGVLTGSSFTNIGNGWYRCTITGTLGAVTSAVVTGYLANNVNNIGYLGDGTSGIYLWGAQLEAGAFPTSYIPTTSATVTRAADVASISSSAFSSWYRQDEGTLFVNATTNATHGGSNSFPRKLSISDGTNSNSIEDYYRVLASYTDTGYVVTVAGVNQAQFDTNNQRNGQSSVIGYAANNFAFAVGGTVVATDLSGTVPTTTQLRLGQRGDGSAALNGTIRRLTYWPVRLPNATLQSLTS